MIILIDIGNSTIKWAVLNRHLGGKDHERQVSDEIDIYTNNSLLYGHNSEDVITGLIDSWNSLGLEPQRILISNVGDQEVFDELEDKIWLEYEIEVETLKSSRKYKNLKNSYSKPSQLGIDRWLNIIGAYEFNEHENNKQGFCVIDCGTAITVDLVNSQAEHMGGLIVPGIKLMQDSLLKNTVKISKNIAKNHRISEQMKATSKLNKNDSILANNTEDAVKGGIYYSVISYIERIIEDLSGLLKNNYVVFLTGGNAHEIYNILKSHKTEHISSIVLEPDLIWQGMACLA